MPYDSVTFAVMRDSVVCSRATREKLRDTVRSAKTIVEAGTQPGQPTPVRLPRITKMMALAIRLDNLIKSGQVTDQADLARVGHVSRARLTQIMTMLQLAQDIQEHLLFLPKTYPFMNINERQIRSLAKHLNWRTQRNIWSELMTRVTNFQNHFQFSVETEVQLV
jgi:hypothetical protein